MSRRDLLGITAGLTAASWLWGQDAQPPVVLKVTVTEGTRYVNGLKPADFRVLEDSILQRISVFAEGSNPPMLVNDDGTTGDCGTRRVIGGSNDRTGSRPSTRCVVSL